MAKALLLCAVVFMVVWSVAAQASENPAEVANDPTHAHAKCNEGGFWKTLHNEGLDPHNPTSCSQAIETVRVAKYFDCEIALPPSLCDFVHAENCKGIKCRPNFNQIDKWSNGNAPKNVASNPHFKLKKSAKRDVNYPDPDQAGFVEAFGEIVAKKGGKKADNEDKDALKASRDAYRKDVESWRELPAADKESKIADLVKGHPKGQKYEASGVCVRDAYIYIVFDNMNGVARLTHSIDKSDVKQNTFIGWEEDSQHEAIACRAGSDILYSVIETKEHGDALHVAIREYDANTLRIIAENYTDAEVEKENTGVEGMTLLTYHDPKTGVYTDYLLALCEGNDCFFKTEERTGEGVVHVLRKHDQRPHGGHKKDVTHDWEIVKTISLPKTANFVDYSDIDIDPTTGRVGVVSQESAAVWIGRFNFTSMEFIDGGEVFRFPTVKGKKGENIQYCNIEGFAWLDDNRFVAVSDKPKKTQTRYCRDKGQSVHIFTLPKDAKQ